MNKHDHYIHNRAYMLLKCNTYNLMHRVQNWELLYLRYRMCLYINLNLILEFSIHDYTLRISYLLIITETIFVSLKMKLKAKKFLKKRTVIRFVLAHSHFNSPVLVTKKSQFVIRNIYPRTLFQFESVNCITIFCIV